ncbi:MAG TPA: M28 family peptidase, partial [Myxococcales bacterium]|nr:M28 family peptidase [Myxococcales bacterium]
SLRRTAYFVPPGGDLPYRSRPDMIAHLLLASLSSAAPAAKGAPLSPAEKAAAAKVSAAALEAHTRFLSHDLLEGRLPGTRGDELAVQYVAAQFRAYGLEPGGEDGTYFQKVPMVGIEVKPPPSVTFAGPAGSKPLAFAVGKDMVISSGNQTGEAKVDAAEVVFVGYGIVAPEYQWDDFKDVDVKGKVLLVMNNDPSTDPALFAGKTRLWYGRWDYKYEQAAKKGAAGVILIHTTPSAAYPWTVVVSSWSGSEHFELPGNPGDPTLQARGWATEDASRAIARLGGQDLDQLRAAAEKRDFRPVPLGVKLSVSFRNDLRKLLSENVLGKVEGSDPKLRDQAVVFTAHHDHFGKKAGAPGEDTIYNGALDNASGSAVLVELARVLAAEKPKRSLLFVAVTAEEQGLLGSEWYCQHPTVPPGRMAANVNIDSVNKDGKTSDVGFIGFGKSSLDGVVEAVARAQGRAVKGDPFPDRGAFYRSDQFNFARRGVPAIYLRGGPTYVGRPAGFGEERADEYIAKHYHQPSDEVDASWSWDGVVEDTQLLLVSGLRIANDARLPEWKPGDEFEAARKKALAADAR